MRRGGKGRPKVSWSSLTPVNALEIGVKLVGMGCGSAVGMWIICGIELLVASGSLLERC